jgi:hypothetical protein
LDWRLFVGGKAEQGRAEDGEGDESALLLLLLFLGEGVLALHLLLLLLPGQKKGRGLAEK